MPSAPFYDYRIFLTKITTLTILNIISKKMIDTKRAEKPLIMNRNIHIG